MKWFLEGKMSNSNFWALRAGDVLLAELRYNRSVQSVRINEVDRRLYFLEQVGFRQNRMLLKTEYNVTIGESWWTKSNQSGMLVVDNNRYSYGVSNKQLTIFDSNRKLTAAVVIENAPQLDVFEFAALVIGFCMHCQKVTDEVIA